MLAVSFDKKLQLINLPLPRRAAGEALIRVGLAGICNTDVEIVKGYMGLRGIIGHEFTGVVEKCGDKSLIGNRGYRRFVESSGERFTIDEQKIRDEARFDGKWVLTTNTDLSARELALKYKQLWQVEAIFRTMKSQLATRPIFHKCDDTIRGHVFCSFLALLLRKELEERLERRGWSLEWADVIRDLDRLQEIEIHLDAKSYMLRTETKGTIGKVFQACGVALPPTLRLC